MKKIWLVRATCILLLMVFAACSSEENLEKQRVQAEASRNLGEAYLREGKSVEVPQIFDHHWLVDVEGLGTFEAYPNRDCRGYVEKFGLDPGVSIYRGLFRYPGYCNTMLNLKKLGLLETGEPESFAGKTNAGKA